MTSKQRQALADAIKEREELLHWLVDAKEREATLRKFIIAQLFPAPVEGKNRVECDIPGVAIAAVLDHKIERKVDQEAIPQLLPELRKKGVDTGLVFRTNYDLTLREYRKLSPPHLKVVDAALIIRPGSSKLEIIVPQ